MQMRVILLQGVKGNYYFLCTFKFQLIFITGVHKPRAPGGRADYFDGGDKYLWILSIARPSCDPAGVYSFQGVRSLFENLCSPGL